MILFWDFFIMFQSADSIHGIESEIKESLSITMDFVKSSPLSPLVIKALLCLI